MKKTLGFICLMALVCGAAFAQEAAQEEGAQQAAEDPMAGMAAYMASEGIVMPGQVATSMGKFTVRGMFVGGVQGYMTDNSAVDGDEKEWGLMAWDPIWTKNSAIIALDYNNGKYGGFFSFGAEDWSGHIEGGLTGTERVNLLFPPNPMLRRQ
jgi:hypothetical protein